MYVYFNEWTVDVCMYVCMHVCTCTSNIGSDRITSSIVPFDTSLLRYHHYSIGQLLCRSR